MKPLVDALRTACALTLTAVATLAQADRAWVLPSATAFSGNDPWVTIDAATSDNIFAYDHGALRLDGLIVQAPDGSRLAPENPNTGRFRSSFDLKLAQTGTYRIAVVDDMLFVNYQLGGEMRRARGSAAAVAAEIPAGATEVRAVENLSRNETFVTSGKTTTTVLAPTGQGLEMVPLMHPNDLVAGEPARFRFLMDGKPAPGLIVSVIEGGVRYRQALGDQNYRTDAHGEVSVIMKTPGMYWLGAMPPRAPTVEGAPPPAGTLQAPLRRISYSATLEVQAP